MSRLWPFGASSISSRCWPASARYWAGIKCVPVLCGWSLPACKRYKSNLAGMLVVSLLTYGLVINDTRKSDWEWVFVRTYLRRMEVILWNMWASGSCRIQDWIKLSHCLMICKWTKDSVLDKSTAVWFCYHHIFWRGSNYSWLVGTYTLEADCGRESLCVDWVGL